VGVFIIKSEALDVKNEVVDASNYALGYTIRLIVCPIGV